MKYLFSVAALRGRLKCLECLIILPSDLCQVTWHYIATATIHVCIHLNVCTYKGTEFTGNTSISCKKGPNAYAIIVLIWLLMYCVIIIHRSVWVF